MTRRILWLCASVFLSVGAVHGQDLRDTVKSAQDSANQSANAFAELRSEVQKLVAAKEFEQAVAKIEEALAKDPENFPANSLRQLVAMQAVASQPKLALEQINKQFEFVLGHIDHPMANVLPSILGVAARVGGQAGDADIADRFADRALEAIRSKVKAGEPSPMYVVRADIVAAKARQLQVKNDTSKAKQLIAEELEQAEAMVAKHGNNPDAIRYLMAAFRNQIMNSDNPGADFERVELFAAGRLKDNPGDMDVLLGYLQTANGYIGFIARREPDVAAAVLDRAKVVLNAGREANKNFEPVAQSMEQMLKRHDTVIASSRKLLELVGQPAPPMDAMQWANGGPIDTDSLKGKVVLLDFWAVWCGPCIMTFPHLIDWQQEYGPKGFQVIGVTRQYGYAWDANANKAAKASEEVSLEAELDMLNKFMASHDLKHPTMVTPAESMMNSNYGVSGIPHAVLIDKAGKVRMIRVGSGDQNAKDLQEMIEKLLSES